MSSGVENRPTPFFRVLANGLSVYFYDELFPCPCVNLFYQAITIKCDIYNHTYINSLMYVRKYTHAQIHALTYTHARSHICTYAAYTVSSIIPLNSHYVGELRHR